MVQKALTWIVLWVCMTGSSWAGPNSLVAPSVFSRSSEPLLVRSEAALIQVSHSGEATGGASLFSGRAGTSLFATPPAPMLAPMGAAGLRDLIAKAEAGKAGYDAVQHGATVKPGKKPTQMTIGQIYSWIKKTPGQPHAIGRYQIIPATLRRLVAKMGVKQSAVFSSRLQDQFADMLLEEAGMSSFLNGVISRKEFMNNIAKVWAGLPNSSGKSHYDGYAGNKATMTWARFETEMKSIFPGLS